MKPPFPLSRPTPVDRLPARGKGVVVEATDEERAVLAKEFDLPAIASLVGRFHLDGTPRRIHVTGTVEATLTRICVVTLDPFETNVSEPVDLEFTEEVREPTAQEELREIDPPDEIVGGRIDLGALCAEFLALGLEPYPRKPGVTLEDVAPRLATGESPFAALGKLKREG